MGPEVRLELQRLLSALCDGQLTAAEHARLNELLEAGPECRRLYLQYVDMHARLLLHPGAGGTLPLEQAPAREDPARALVPPRPRGGWLPQPLRYALVAAASLAASLLFQLAWRHPEPAPDPAPAPAQAPLAGYVATLTRTADCAWDRASQALQAGVRLLPGELRLRNGVAYIRFDSGPDLVVEGPAVLRLESSAAATVLRGKVVFRGDETAPPFDLHTPGSTLVDFGTEYAVSVGPGGEEIHVFDGEVQRRSRPPAGGDPAPAEAAPEHLKAGEARRYGLPPDPAGQPTPVDPARFVRWQAPEPAWPGPGLLAYEGFAYADREGFSAGRAQGGAGWAGPWMLDFARPLNKGDNNRLVLNARSGLNWPGAASPPVGGCFEYAGFAKCFRRLAAPVRLDADSAYYLSFLFRRHGPSASEVNAVAVLLWTDEDFRQVGHTRGDPRRQLNVGVRGWNQLFTQLHDVSSRTPLPLRHGDTYLLVAKIAASRNNPDQVFMRVYGPDEPVDPDEPASWSVAAPPFRSDLCFDWLQLHVNSTARQTIDELRLGTTWSSVVAPWRPAPGPPSERKP